MSSETPQAPQGAPGTLQGLRTSWPLMLAALALGGGSASGLWSLADTDRLASVELELRALTATVQTMRIELAQDAWGRSDMADWQRERFSPLEERVRRLEAARRDDGNGP